MSIYSRHMSLDIELPTWLPEELTTKEQTDIFHTLYRSAKNKIIPFSGSDAKRIIITEMNEVHFSYGMRYLGRGDTTKLELAAAGSVAWNDNADLHAYDTKFAISMTFNKAHIDSVNDAFAIDAGARIRIDRTVVTEVINELQPKIRRLFANGIIRPYIAISLLSGSVNTVSVEELAYEDRIKAADRAIFIGEQLRALEHVYRSICDGTFTQ